MELCNKEIEKIMNMITSRNCSHFTFAECRKNERTEHEPFGQHTDHTKITIILVIVLIHISAKITHSF